MNYKIIFLFLTFILLINFSNALVPCLNDDYGLIYETSKISELCKELEDSTGIQSAIVITNFSEDIDSYALKLFDENNIGEKNKDNGFLILINPEDNNWIILVGYGLEVVLNDAKLANIGRTYLEPQIDEGNYNDAVIDTYAIIGMTLLESQEFKKEKKFWKDNWPIILGIIILILIIILTKGKIFFIPIFNNRGFGGGRTGGARGKK